MFAQGVGNFMPHHHRHFVFGELQLVQNAVIKSDLAPGHTKRVDLRRTDQVDFPFPVFGAWVPFVTVGNQLLRNRTQTDHLGVVIRRERVFIFGLLEHLGVLLVGRAFYLLSRYQFGEAGCLAHLDAVARQQGSRGQAKRTACTVVYKLSFREHGV